jgi:type I restriction enzyme M protein
MAKKNNNSDANVGFEYKLWQAADKMRGHMDPSEYKHVVLGLLFLKYISDSFEGRRKHLESELNDSTSDFYTHDTVTRHAILEDRDEYLADNVFWVTPEARWSYLQDNAKQPTIRERESPPEGHFAQGLRPPGPG